LYYMRHRFLQRVLFSPGLLNKISFVNFTAHAEQEILSEEYLHHLYLVAVTYY
jgi:hypothetical protein